MKLNRNNLFISILAFLLVVNILLWFDINQFYIRATLAFIFLITIPGLLVMLMFRIRKINFWEYLVYTVGLSVSFIMFAGLAVNWTLPFLHITDKPLSLIPILTSFNIFLLIFWFVAFYRNKDLKFEIKSPKLDWTNRIFIIVPMLFPVLSILGALILNNFGPNYLTMIMLGGIAVYVLMIVIFRKKINDNVWPWAILMISVSILLSGWLRSWYVSGPDISLEYWVFQLTKNNAYWSISNFNHAYNAMISLNIFPTILSYFINANNQFIFKLFIPIIFSITSLIVYLISRKNLSCLFSFLAGLLFLSSPDFVNWYSIPVRQEVAFLFFGLMLLVLFSKNISLSLKKILSLVFGFSMIVSHYSTTYIALAIFVLSYILTLKYKQWENRKIKKEKLKPKDKQKFHLNGFLLLLLLVFGFLWYSQISNVASGPISFMKNSFNNLDRMFKEDVRQGGATDPIFGFFNKPQVGNLIEDYKNKSSEYDLSNKSEGFPKESYVNYQMRYMQWKILEPKIKSLNLFMIIYYSKQIISKIFQLFIFFGLFCVIKNREIETDLKSIFIGTSLVIGMFFILPFFSIDYSITRLIQQTLIILSPLSIIGGKVFFVRINIKSPIVISILLIIFFLLFSGFISQFFGGDEAKLQLNNFGKDYNLYYMFSQDSLGADWLNKNKGDFIVYADANAHLKLNSFASKLNSENTDANLVPNTISKQSYVYLSAINNLINVGFFSMKGFNISYNFPKEFLNDNKNKIYNNGGSEIFK